jgi:tetratricopeptide (TPR) repeat protein
MIQRSKLTRLQDDTKTDAEEIYIREWLRDRYPECDSVIYDQILETFDVEKTQYYYAALGWFLVTSFPVDMDDKKLADQRNRAKETFQQALEIDPHYWLALQGFGWSLLPAPSLDKTSLLYEEALENCPKSLKQTRLLLKGSIIGFLMSGKDYETAAKSCAEDYISKPEEFNAGQVRLIGKYLRSCFALGEDDRVHNIVLDILRPAKADALLSLLELNGEHYIIGNTLWKNGEVVKIIQPLLDMFFESDQSMSAKNSPWMVIPCVRLINDYYPSADTVLKILELIAAPKFSADLSVELRSNFEIGRKEIERYLAGIYNDKAHEAHRAGKDPKEWVDKLRVLATAAKRNNGQAPTYLISSVSLLLGECLRENGATEQEWKACIRPTMMQGIDLLCDDDLFNDFDAYEMLVNALTAAGDVHNAIAAQVPCTMGLVYPDIKDKLSKLGYPKTWFGCSGTCWLDDLRAKPKDSGFEYDTFREMWRCMQCFNVQFCEKCVEVAKAGQTPKRICGKDHPLIKFCPPPDDLKTRVVNWNAENETVDVNKEWLEGLRKEWS